MSFRRQCSAYLFSGTLVLSTLGCAQAQPNAGVSEQQAGMPGELAYQAYQSPGQPAIPVTQQTPEQLQQLVAPIIVSGCAGGPGPYGLHLPN